MEGPGDPTAGDDYYELLDMAKESLAAGDDESALRVYQDVSDQLIDASEGDLRGIAAFALFAKARRLARLERFDESLSTTALLLGRYEHASERDVRLYVASALLGRAQTLIRRKKWRRALRALDDTLARSVDSDDSDFRAIAATALAYKVSAEIRLFRPRASAKAASQLIDYIGSDPDPKVLDAVLRAVPPRRRALFLRSLPKP